MGDPVPRTELFVELCIRYAVFALCIPNWLLLVLLWSSFGPPLFLTYWRPIGADSRSPALRDMIIEEREARGDDVDSTTASSDGNAGALEILLPGLRFEVAALLLDFMYGIKKMLHAIRCHVGRHTVVCSVGIAAWNAS